MRKSELIDRYVAKVQGLIVDCPNDEPMVEGETLWIQASGCSVLDLLIDCNVPEKYHYAVSDRLRCPKCGSPFDIGQEVGTQWDFEAAHEGTVAKAMHKYGEEIFRFSEFLHKYPMSGMAHRFGRRLLRELIRAPHFTLPGGQWFRAKMQAEHCSSLAPREFVGDQRYNSSGHPFFYLANDPKCAAVELLANEEADVAWVQAFDLDTLEDVLDLRPWNAEDDRVLDGEGNYDPKHPLLLVALLYSDLLLLTPQMEGKGVRHKPEYLMPRFVSDAARLAGFSAILFRSVRYDGDNLVVFKEDWQPKPHGEPTQITLAADDRRHSKGMLFHNGERFVLPNYDLPSPDWPPPPDFVNSPITKAPDQKCGGSPSSF